MYSMSFLLGVWKIFDLEEVGHFRWRPQRSAQIASAKWQRREASNEWMTSGWPVHVPRSKVVPGGRVVDQLRPLCISSSFIIFRHLSWSCNILWHLSWFWNISKHLHFLGELVCALEEGADFLALRLKDSLEPKSCSPIRSPTALTVAAVAVRLCTPPLPKNQEEITWDLCILCRNGTNLHNSS